MQDETPCLIFMSMLLLDEQYSRNIQPPIPTLAVTTLPD